VTVEENSPFPKEDPQSEEEGEMEREEIKEI
jgi:hypothetical protein